MENLCDVGKILENSKGTSHSTTTTAVLFTTCMNFDLLYSLPSCFRRAGGQYPTSLLMLLVVTVVLLLFKKKSEGA